MSILNYIKKIFQPEKPETLGQQISFSEIPNWIQTKKTENEIKEEKPPEQLDESEASSEEKQKKESIEGENKE